MAPPPFIPPSAASIQKTNEANRRRLANLVSLIHKSVPSPTLNPIHPPRGEIPSHFTQIGEYEYGAARPVAWDKGIITLEGDFADGGGEFPVGVGDVGRFLRGADGWIWLVFVLAAVTIAVWGGVFWVWKNGWASRGRGRVDRGGRVESQALKGWRDGKDRRRRERRVTLDEESLDGRRKIGREWRGLVKSVAGPGRWDGNVDGLEVEWRVVDAC